VQDKVAAELDAAGLLVTPARPQPRELVPEDLTALHYLIAATKEAMRMYPVVSWGPGRWGTPGCLASDACLHEFPGAACCMPACLDGTSQAVLCCLAAPAWPVGHCWQLAGQMACGHSVRLL
jgi:hypothetical protein